jgi:hypothetical protein
MLHGEGEVEEYLTEIPGVWKLCRRDIGELV